MPLAASCHSYGKTNEVGLRCRAPAAYTPSLEITPIPPGGGIGWSRWLVHSDFGLGLEVLGQCLDPFILNLAVQVGAGALVVDEFLEIRNLERTRVVHLDDVEAVVGFDWCGRALAFLERQHAVEEFRHNHALIDPAEVAAVSAGLHVERLGLGERGEIAAFLDLRDQALGLVFAL